ncbi:cbb3-type cytochrome c oxidase subunit I [Polaromonas sp. CG_9.11]|uniref:cbb3-type cytochrome c oxidase subunit I n=1 Tax=Polaromonas sp. CG_9.11 TaxID=2787730 RepID=UPI0018C8FC8D|nr:cbb3-type cytochrome c oxidase subunit I [Polaromonas sp. CG_9.11]MBG6075164.1 cytochrome o ubiquinol oxidase subunit 1 [Polaromonas sp. CG_9.11]
MTETYGLRHWVFGNLGYDALPFYSLLASVAAGMVVLGALTVVGLVTRYGKWRYVWSEWLTSLDHKRIGIMYVVLAMVMLSRALVEAVLIRLQQAVAINAPGFLEPEHFAQLFSTHGTVMIFFVAMPFLTGLINYVMPLQIGARDVAFPLLNSISLGLTASGAALVMVALVVGRFSTGGWTGYPPFTGIEFSPGVGPDYWIWAVSLTSLGTTMTGINFAVTIYKNRAPGMQLFRMPLFCWTALCTSILMLFAMPPLTVATAMLALDRYLGMHFFTNDMGGNIMNYANLFWLFGHPEVYILILPAFGVYSEVIPVFATKRLYGYVSLVYATMAIAVLSFTVWLHHFFTMGQTANMNAAFGIATMTIGIPTGVKVYDWILTMFRGRIRFTVPMLYAQMFIVTFVLGGMTGIMLATPPLDYVVHNTVFLVAHFHNMLIPGLLFGMLAGYQFWFPKAFGFRLDETWGRIGFVCWSAGFYLAFMPLYVLGVQGMPRRSQALFESAYRPWLLVAAVGALVLFCGLASLFIQLWVSIRRRDQNRVAAGDPWDGRGLEWSVAAPPPAYNFAVLPEISGRDAFWQSKLRAQAYVPAAHYADIELPKNSAIGAAIAVAGTACGFGLVWHIWWLAILGFVVIWGAVIARSFVRNTQQVIKADDVCRSHTGWLTRVGNCVAISRELETTASNQGLARAEP